MKFKLFFALILLAASIGWAVYEYNNPYGSYQKYFDYAMENYNDGYYELAIDYFSYALSDKPQDGITCFYMGLCYIEINDYQLANTYFDLAIQYEPKLQKKYDKAGLSKYKTDDYLYSIFDKDNDESSIESNTYVRTDYYDRDFTDPKDYNDLGLTEYNDKNYADAIMFFTKAVELDDKYIYSLYNIGLCYYYLGKYENAVEQYSLAIEADSSYSNAYFERAFVNYELGNYNESIDDYTKYIEFEPAKPKAYTNRGLAKYNFGNTKGACIDWNISISLGGDANEFLEKYCK